MAQLVKNPPANAGDAKDEGLIPGWGRYPGEGNGNSLQYSCLGNSMDRGAWWVMVRGGHEELDRTEHMHTHIGNIYRLSNREGPRDKEMYHIENKAS